MPKCSQGSEEPLLVSVRISERKFLDLLRRFALDITADSAADLSGLHHDAALALCRFLRLKVAKLAREGRPCRGRVEAGFSRHHRIDRCADPDHPDFAENGVHINGIDSLQSHARRHNQKFNGPHADSFPVVLRDTGFRVNNRTNDLCGILLKSCGPTPLRPSRP